MLLKIVLLTVYVILILARSSWSRADDPIEIGDLTEEESLEYLIKKHRINKVEAEKLYKLVGGRIIDLNSVVNKIQKGRSLDGRIDFIK